MLKQQDPKEYPNKKLSTEEEAFFVDRLASLLIEQVEGSTSVTESYNKKP